MGRACSAPAKYTGKSEELLQSKQSLGRAAKPGGMCFYLCFNQIAIEETLQAQLHLLEGCPGALTPAACHVNSRGAEQ